MDKEQDTILDNERDTGRLQVVQQMTRRYFVSIPLYLVTLLVSALNVEVSLVLYMAITLLYALPANRFPFGNGKKAAEGKGR